MSPLVEGRVVRDLDGFLRDERGLRSMAHLATAVILSLAAAFGLNSVVAFWMQVPGWDTFAQYSMALGASAAGLEGYQSTVESRNQRELTGRNH